jgi:SAM domain (Sterile alpha motif)
VGAMQEIADWLTRLGLPEYAGAFAENGIDVSRADEGILSLLQGGGTRQREPASNAKLHQRILEPVLG